MPQIALSDMPYEATVLADDLVDGNPAFGWKGDPRLYLQVGVLTAAKTGQRNGKWYKEGEMMARRYEVWRHNEDGTDLRILSRDLTHLHEILPALVKIDPRTPGHEATMDRIERENAVIDKHREQAIGEAVGEMTEHLWNVVSERENGKQTHFQVGGSRDD